MTLIRLFSSILAAALLLSSCGNDSGRLLDFRNTMSSFTVRFDSADGEVVCEAMLNEPADDRTLTLAVVSPGRSEGVTVVCGADFCIVSAEGMEIPMSADSSRSIRDFFLILSSDTPDNLPMRSKNGEETVIEFARGSLTLDGELKPCAVTYAGMDGEMRTAVIDDFSSLYKDS